MLFNDRVLGPIHWGPNNYKFYAVVRHEQTIGIYHWEVNDEN